MIENQTIKDRLILFINSLGLSKMAFEVSCGLSNGYIGSIRKGIGHNALEQISEKHPNLNTGWLLTGEGTMLRSPLSPENILGSKDDEDDHIREGEEKVALLVEIDNLKKQIAKKEERIDKLEARIDNKEEQIDMLIRNLDRLTAQYTTAKEAKVTKGNKAVSAKNA